MAEMQKKEYFLAINGKKYGPISGADIQRLVNENKINENTKFAKSGMKEWLPLSESGFINSFALDGVLPSLPDENTKQSTPPVKKSKSVLAPVLVSICFLFAFFVFIGVLASTQKQTTNNSSNQIINSAMSTTLQPESNSGIDTLSKINNENNLSDVEDFPPPNVEDNEGLQRNTPESQSRQVAKDTEEESNQIPDEFLFGLQRIHVEMNEYERLYLQLYFSNNTEANLARIVIRGKCIDKNGVVIGDFEMKEDRILAYDVVKFQSVWRLEDETSFVRFDTVFVGGEITGLFSATGFNVELTDIIPVLSISDLESQSFNHYLTQKDVLGFEINVGSQNTTTVARQPERITAPPTTERSVLSPKAYDLEDYYIFPYSNSSLLTASDLYGMTNDQLRLARNEIYARHGYVFSDTKLQEHFANKPWYYPIHDNSAVI